MITSIKMLTFILLNSFFVSGFFPGFLFSLFYLLSMTMTNSIYYGTLVHSVSLTELEILVNGVLVVDSTKGVIVHVEKDVKDLDAFLVKYSFQDAEVKKSY
jgi:hypothetical protein